MRSKLLSIFLIIAFFAIDIQPQTFNTGGVEVNLNNFGRIRLSKSTPSVVRQLDRASILVGVSSSQVFDYQQDANGSIPAGTVTPTVSDFKVYGQVNNTFSNLPPKVTIGHHVYGWTNNTYVIVEYWVKNDTSVAISAFIGLEIHPQVGGTYGNEVYNWNAANRHISISKASDFLGVKLLSNDPISVKAFEYSSTFNTDANFYSYLTSGTIDNNYASGSAGAVVIAGQEMKTINPGDSIKFAVAYAYATSENGLTSSLASALNRYVTVLPVELTSFAASLNGSTVHLNWSTATEINNLGFEIQRKSANSEFSTVGFTSGAGTITEPKNYSFSDDVSSVEGGVLVYRLKQVDFDGRFEYSNEIEVEITPFEFNLSQNFPNPFNPSTEINFNIAKEGFFTLKVYDASGTEVETLISSRLNAGTHRITFDASKLSSGNYFYRLSGENFSEVKKMTLIK